MEGVIPHSWGRQDSTSNSSSASLSENDKNPMKRSKTDALPAHAGLEHRVQRVRERSVDHNFGVSVQFWCGIQSVQHSSTTFSPQDSVNGRPTLSDLTNVPVKISDQNNKVRSRAFASPTQRASATRMLHMLVAHTLAPHMQVKTSSHHAGTWGTSIPSSIFNDPSAIDSSAQSGALS